jgi:hypothetical protein
LKDDVAFALLTTIFPHIVAMLNEIDNLPKLDTILSGEPIGLGNYVSWQRDINTWESSSRRDNKS